MDVEQCFTNRVFTVDAPNAHELQQFNQQADQALHTASILENRYKIQPHATDDIAGFGANVTGSDDDGVVVLVSPTVPELENEVKIQLLKLIRHYEKCVNDSATHCAIDFTYARQAFEQLFAIWTKIRIIYDIVKYASVWEEATLSEGQMNLQEVNRQINEALIQHLFRIHLPLFNEAIRRLSIDTKRYITAHQQMHQQQLQQQFQAYFEPDGNVDQEAQSIFERFDYLLDFFYDSVDRVKYGTLSVWRREQKKAMLGIGLTVEMAKDLNATKPAIALRDATTQFQELAMVWMQIDRLLCIFCSSRLSPLAPTMQKSHACVQHLLQSSLVVDWRYERLCQPHIVVRQEGKKEGVAVIVKILAAIDGFRVPEGQFPPLVNVSKSTIAAVFVKPQNNSVALSEDIAIQLRDGLIESRQQNNYIERAGNITHMEKSTSGVLQTIPIVDPNDKTVSALFEDVVFVLKDDRRRKGDKQRNACTKYHIDVTAEVFLNCGMPQMTPTMSLKLQTLSTPFSYSVGNMQDKILYRSFVWNLLGSHPDSVSCHCQPLIKDAEDLSLVYWGDYREALKWLFYKLTHSRTLYDEELQHLGYRLFGNNDFSLSKTFGSLRGDPCWPGGFSQIRTSASDRKSNGDKRANNEKVEKFAPFFFWYYEAIELVIDRQESLARPTDPPGEERLTMARLFQSGMILGFISRTGSEELLKASDRSAMIIRFSDHFSGHITISYINKKTEDSPEKLEHVRPLNRSLLAGMGLPVLVAMLINLTDVMHIITARLSNGKTSLTDEDYRWKQDLVKDHLENYEGGKYSHTEEEKYSYANRIMLQTQEKKRRDARVDEATTSARSAHSSRRSQRPPEANRSDDEHDPFFDQYRKWKDHPEMMKLINKLDMEAKQSASSGTVSPSLASPWPSLSEYNLSVASPYASSQMSPLSNLLSQMTPSPIPSQPYIQAQSPLSTASSATFNRQSPFLQTQFAQMSMQSTNQTPQSFQPTNQTMGYQPTTGMHMMQPQQQQPMVMPPGQQQPMVMQSGQQQPMMMQAGQQTQWPMQPQMQQSSTNAMQNYHQQQQLQMGMQQMSIDPQQQHGSFMPPMNPYQQQQMMMQQNAMPQIGHQQVANQHVAMNPNMQPQMMQQQPVQSSFVQQPQQGMVQSSYPTSYQLQQQYYPQLQTQQPTYSPQQFSNTLPASQPLQTPNFQSQNQAPMSDDESEPEYSRSFEEEDNVENLYETHGPFPAKARRKH